MTASYQQVLLGTYDNHVLPFLWMRGEDYATIREYLEKIAGADIREVCLESRPHPDFCGKGWFDDLRFIIAECKRLGLRIWILDDSHFPTGYANGALEGEDVDPALKKTVLVRRTVDVAGPMPGMKIDLANFFDPTERFVGAVAMRGGEALDVAFVHEGDTLAFDAPAGPMRVTLLFTSKKTGYRDEYINMVSSASCRALVDAVYEPHYRELGDEFGKTILGFFTDEPGFMNEKGTTADGALETDTLIGKGSMPLPWSAELEAELRRLLGEPSDDELFALLARLWDREESGAYARHAYMDAATRCYRSCFDEQIGAWCRERGVMHIGHVIEDKGNHAHLGQGAGHYFRAIGGQDMAGIDVVINQLVPGMDEGEHSYGRGTWDMEFFTYALAKLGSSAAHLDPLKKGRCMAEVFGAFGWHEGLKEMVWIANHFLVRGVNWFVPHAFSMAPFPDPDCPPHFYAHGNNPQFRQFGKLMRYLNRMGTLLSGGRAHTPVAVLYHADAAWAGKAMPAQKVAVALAREQIDFDFIPADAFGDAERYAVEISDGGFSVNGQPYQCLVVPSAEYASRAVCDFVAKAAGTGIPVLCVCAAPSRTYDGEAAAEKGFSALPGGAFSRASIVSLECLAVELVRAGIGEVRTGTPQRWLRTYRYTGTSGEEYLFAVNESPREVVETTLSDAAGEPLVGASIDVLNDGAAAVFSGELRLEPYEARLIVLGEQAPATACAAGEPVALDAPWTLSFAAPLAYPAFGEAREVAVPAAAQSEPAYFDRCGTFRYETAFELDGARTLALDCGEAYEMVEVLLDGKFVDARIAPPYRLAFDAAAGEHVLAIDVTNTVDKSVSDMFALTEAKEPSGLFGPVTLTATKGE